jgi:hypothetical protein
VAVGTRGDAGLVEITEGLTEADLVVVSGLTKLSNGTAVEVRTSDMPGKSDKSGESDS